MKKLKCIINANCESYFNVGDIYDGDDYDEKSYIIIVAKDNDLIKVKAPKRFFSEDYEDDIQVIDEELEVNYVFDTIKMMKYDSLLITMQSLNDLCGALSSVLLSKTKPDEIPEKLAKLLIGLDLLKASMNISDELLFSEKQKFIEIMESLLRENKPPIV